MTDPRNAGLSDLGQRMQAMSGPAPDTHLAPHPESRPDPRQRSPLNSLGQFHGAPLPIGPAATGSRPIPSYPMPSNEDLKTPIHAGSPPALTPPAAKPSAAPPEPAAAAQIAAQPQAALPAPDDSAALTSGLQHAVSTAMPFLQKLLPLLDGGIAAIFRSLTAPQQPQPPATPPPVRVDLAPVERGLAEVNASHRELRTLVQEQAVALKRAEDQLERVREATDRNTLEQQELVEDLRSVGNRVSNLAVIGLVLLVVLLGLNLYFLVQFQHILR